MASPPASARFGRSSPSPAVTYGLNLSLLSIDPPGALKTRLPVTVVTLRLVRNPSCSNNIGAYVPSASIPIHFHTHHVAETPAVPLVDVVSPPKLRPAKGETCSCACAVAGRAST